VTPAQQIEAWLEGLIDGTAPDPQQLQAFEALLPSMEPAVLASLRPLIDEALSIALHQQSRLGAELDQLGSKRAGLRRYGGLRPVATTRQRVARRA
jgi:hypothetical protein